MAVKFNSKKILFVVYFLVIQIFAGFFVYEKIRGYFYQQDDFAKYKTEKVEPLPAVSESPANYARPNIENNANQDANSPNSNVSNENSAVQKAANENLAAPIQDTSGQIMIPVVGVKKAALTDTFNDARSAGRVHNAIDIMAPGGTPVVAAVDGTIVKFFDSKLGGITIYQYSAELKKIFYYAHLQKRADNLKETDFVKQGIIIGYVGDTGNAGAGNYHLHFSIVDQPDPKKYWQGTEENPFPILKQGIEAAAQ